MHGESFSAYSNASDAGKLPVLSDSFAVDLASHHST